MATPLQDLFDKYNDRLAAEGFTFERTDFERPWGGFFVIDEAQAPAFIERYFPGLTSDDLIGGRKVSPKILVVAPGKRLSWQYHHRREEVWRVVDGPVAVAHGPSDEQPDPNTYQTGDTVVLAKGERHRLIGLDAPGIVAEIWQHTDPNHPSDEEDIVRLQDDFGRD